MQHQHFPTSIRACGVTESDYRAALRDGQEFCTRCRRFRPVVLMSDETANRCKQCRAEVNRARQGKRDEAKRAARKVVA